MNVASSLIAKGCVREIRAKADAPVWHENEDGRFALKITTGREAIGIDEDQGEHAASPRRPMRPSRRRGADQNAPRKRMRLRPSPRARKVRGRRSGRSLPPVRYDPVPGRRRYVKKSEAHTIFRRKPTEAPGKPEPTQASSQAAAAVPEFGLSTTSANAFSIADVSASALALASANAASSSWMRFAAWPATV
jgi:hypothetical protein